MPGRQTQLRVNRLVAKRVARDHDRSGKPGQNQDKEIKESERSGARARKIRADIVRLTRLAERYEAEAEKWKAFEQGLPETNKARTLSEMEAVPYQMRRGAANRPKRGRPPKTKHPFPVALYNAGTDPTSWATKHGYSRETVKSWYAEGDGGRPIPLEAAQLINKQFGVPATKAVWKNSIK
jgi:hypothetical protein